MVNVQLLYSRLLLCKEVGEQLAAKKHVSLRPNPIAVELGLDDRNGPSAVLAHAMDALRSQTPNASANVAYMYLLEAWEKVCDNELDQATFEEHMRWFFGNKVRWKVFISNRCSKQSPGLPCVHSGQVDYRARQAGKWLECSHCAYVMTVLKGANNRVGQ
jgi:hypothetical protein